jgi:hypothetical protein
MRAYLTEHTKVMGFLKKRTFFSHQARSQILSSVVREKETTMGCLSLNKIGLSKIAKVPGMVILGVLALAFLVFPLAAFANCGQPAPDAATLESRMALFGPTCGSGKLTATQASLAAESWNTKAGTKSAPALNSAESLLAAAGRCTFDTIKTGQKVALQNGDILLITITKNSQEVPAIGEVVNGKIVLIAGDGQGGHFDKLVQNPNIKIANANLPQD